MVDLLEPAQLPTAPGDIQTLCSDPINFFAQFAPVGDIVRTAVGQTPVYVLSDPDDVHRILVEDARHYDKGFAHSILALAWGSGLVTAHRDLHRMQRRLTQPLFSRDIIATTYATTVTERVQNLVEGWHDGQRLDLTTEVARLTREIMISTVIRTPIDDPDVNTIWNFFDATNGEDLKSLAINDSDPATHERSPYAHSVHYIKAAAENIVKKREQAPQNHTNDFLEKLLTTRDYTDAPLSRNLIRDEIITMLFAGSESTSSTLAWALYHISLHPKIGKKIQAEVDAVLPDGGAASYQDLAALSYTTAILNEVLRLYGVSVNSRRNTDPTTLGGVRFPAGSEFLFSHSMLHRNPTYYPRPEVFDPERWVDPAVAPNRRYFMPFSKGTRNCIGADFAMVEATIALATIARHWQVVLTDSDSIRIEPALFLCPNHVNATVRRRRN